MNEEIELSVVEKEFLKVTDDELMGMISTHFNELNRLMRHAYERNMRVEISHHMSHAISRPYGCNKFTVDFYKQMRG